MKKKSSRFIFWAPRILAILFILFLAMFSLDIFDGNYGFWGTILGLFMHNIPSMVLTAILIIAWKYELAGAIMFGSLGAAGITVTVIMISRIHEISVFNPIFIITGIVAGLIGILFFIGWKKEK